MIAAASSSPRIGRPASHVGHLARICIADLKVTWSSAREERGQRQVAHRVQPGRGGRAPLGIELTTMDVVAMSPWMPPAILTCSRGEPSISIESYVSGAPRYASMCRRMAGSPFR